LKYKSAIAFIIILAFIFGSCVTTGFKEFYDSWHDDNYFPIESYLGENEIPQIIAASDLNSKFREVSSNWYWCLGYSGFNGPQLDDSEIKQALTKMCREKKAKLAIYSKEFTDSRVGSIPHTNYHTTYDANGFAHTETTTTYSNYNIERYDFSSYLFVSIPDEYKIAYAPGFSVADLTQEDRDLYKQNTGCLINIVYINSIAYYSNLVHGDIITRINETPIYSSDDYFLVMKKSTIDDTWNMTIIRNGQEKQIKMLYALRAK